MRIAAPVVTLELLDLLADRACLLLGVPAGGHLDLLARLVLGAQRLAEPALVVGDEVRGGGEDVGGGAVIALEADDPGAGKIVLEAQDVVHLRPAPAVDRLVVVADAADVFERSPRLLHGRCGRLGALPLPACIRTRVYPSSVTITGRSRIYPTSAERVGVRGALGAWRFPPPPAACPPPPSPHPSTR